MNAPLMVILAAFSMKAKPIEVVSICCPRCCERARIIRHGYYERYWPSEGDERIRVSRFRCLNPSCPSVTFSVLPYPVLRWVRFRLCQLVQWWFDHLVAGLRIQDIARRAKVGWARVRRALVVADRVEGMMRCDQGMAGWGMWPCMDPPRTWGRFNAWLSHLVRPPKRL